MQEDPLSLEINTEEIPMALPILSLNDVVLFPRMVLPLIIKSGTLRRYGDKIISENQIIGFAVNDKSKGQNSNPQQNLKRIGTSGIILKKTITDDKKIQLLIHGLSRFEILTFFPDSPYLQAAVDHIEEQKTKDALAEALMHDITGLFQKVIKHVPNMPKEIEAITHSIKEPGILADFIVSHIDSTVEEKQKILEMIDVKDRLKEVIRLVNNQLEILELRDKIQTNVKGDIDKNQKEFYLRQQLKMIKKELGDEEEDLSEIEEYRAKIDEKNLPELALKEAERELTRLSRIHPASAEYTVASTYLDWITSLPWHERTEDSLDIKTARRILNEDHFGLVKAKKRIIEYLAVRKLKPDSKGPILCFTGPPGTGKTSMGRSIARALGRKFIRISLGGVRDEAEIRGHRRTYVGALPGRIIQGLRRVQVNNPVFMLDEVDKLGRDFSGDPSSALLEVLDPEQNYSFSDHYLDIPFDLSNIMFITTGNMLDTVPHALKDRMEVIEFSGYTDDEKIKITNLYLISRQREAHGLKDDQITFTRESIKRIISGYTREAGLRNLEREIANICRGVATQIVEGDVKSAAIGVKDISGYLGPVRLPPAEAKDRTSTPGVVMGLAWTQAGGDLLFIEATSMKGDKGLILTGQLGDVMKESAQAALSFIKANISTLEIPEDAFTNLDIHIHVPAGAIPKDGPSAGVTLLTALVSLLTEKNVKQDLAMTGEITLRGRVLPVGGVKEKILAANRAGIKIIILPKWNKKDLEEIPKKIQKHIQFHFVDKMLDVLKIALEY